MKNLGKTFFYTLFSLAIFKWLLPWWVILPIGLFTGFMGKAKAGQAFLAGFLAVFVLWFGYATFLYIGNNELMAHKISKLLKVPSGDIILYITGIIGGILGGFSVMTGALFAQALEKDK